MIPGRAEDTKDIEALIRELKSEDRLPSLKAPEYSAQAGHFIALDYIVNLQESHDEAVRQKAHILEVFADTVVVPESFVRTLGVGVSMLGVVARRIRITGGDAALRMLGGKATPRIRVLSDKIDGKLLLRTVKPSAGPGGNVHHSVELRTGSTSDLKFAAYTLKENQIVPYESRLPMELLKPDAPLHQLLSAGFELAAGAFARSTNSAQWKALADSLLEWLVRWATYPSNYLIRSFEAAAGLRSLLPSDDGKRSIHQVPARGPRKYLDLAREQASLAGKYFQDVQFKDAGADLRKGVKGVIQAWIDRDLADLAELEKHIGTAREDVSTSKKALQSASKSIEDLKLNITLAKIDLKRVLAEERVKEIVKETFQILAAVLELGISASSGLPHLKVQPELLNPLFAFTSPLLAGVSLADRALIHLKMYVAVPKAVWDQLKSLSSKDREELFKSLMEAGTAISHLYAAYEVLSSLDERLERLEEIGKIVSETEGLPDPIAAKAAWRAFEVEAVNQLENILGDKETSGAVRDAALTLKTALEQYAIFSRALVEHQALLAERTRQWATLLLRQATAKKKSAELATLSDALDKESETIENLKRIGAARLSETRQVFFVALCQYRAAYFYQNLDLDVFKKVPLDAPRDYLSMEQVLTDIQDALVKVKPRSQNNFQSKKTISRSNDPGFFRDLDAGKPARFEITSQDPLFSRDKVVRLRKMETRLVGTNETDTVEVTVSSSTSFHDRGLAGEEMPFSRDPVQFYVRYKGGNVTESEVPEVLPTPFTTWTVTIESPKDLRTVGRIEFELFGTSVRD
jgi:hypothetical protein